MARRKGSAAEQRWRDRMRRWPQAGMSVREFCAQEGVSEPSFYHWRRRLGQAPKRTAAKASPHDLSFRPRFVPVEVIESADSSRSPSRWISYVDNVTFEVALPRGVHVRLDARLDEDTLRRVLRAVVAETRGC